MWPRTFRIRRLDFCRHDEAKPGNRGQPDRILASVRERYNIVGLGDLPEAARQLDTFCRGRRALNGRRRILKVGMAETIQRGHTVAAPLTGTRSAASLHVDRGWRISIQSRVSVGGTFEP